MNHKNLTFDISDQVATVTLNRPSVANSLDVLTCRELMDVAIQCDENRSVRAVVITGNGKMFSAGGDVRSFAQAGDTLPGTLKEMTTYLHAAISRFTRMQAPTIAAINGTAAGAGMSLACSCDMVVMSDDAKMTLAYTGVGLVPDGSSSYFLPRVIGTRRTAELMLTNRTLSAEDALAWGLVNKVVPGKQVLKEAQALASTLAEGPTAAYGSIKRLLASSFQESLETQMEFETRAIAEAAGSNDGREGILAFSEKRRPQFKGN